MQDLKSSYLDIYNKSIVLLGPTPPPYGGISVHISRSIDKLISQKNRVNCFDTIKRSNWFVIYFLKFIFFIICKRPTVIIYHSSYAEHSEWEMLFLIVLCMIIKTEIIIVDHDPLYLDQQSRFFKLIFNFFIKKALKQVIIGSTTYASYLKNNIFLKENATIESSFLLPNLSKENEIVSMYPQELFSFILKNKLLLVANAYHLICHEDGDLYGFDLMIELMKIVLGEYKNVGLVFSLSKIGDHHLYQNYLKKINDLDLNRRIFIFLGEKEFWPLLKMADIFLRPTRSDSFGISVAEALYFGVTAIASNVCQRPFGTILYKSGEKKDFFDKVMFQINLIEKTKNWKHNGLYSIKKSGQKVLESSKLWD